LLRNRHLGLGVELQRKLMELPNRATVADALRKSAALRSARLEIFSGFFHRSGTCINGLELWAGSHCKMPRLRATCRSLAYQSY
jgi:hypothetical protein